MQTEFGTVPDRCPICMEKDIKRNVNHDIERYSVACPVCGEYHIDRSPYLYGLDRPETKERAHELSGLIRERCEEARRATQGSSSRIRKRYRDMILHIKSLDPDKIDELLSGVPKTAKEKADRLLQALARNSKHPGAPVRIDPETDYPWAYTEGSRELKVYYLEHLLHRDLISKDGGQYVITVKGWERIEKLAESRAGSRIAFVAMSFDKKDPRLKGLYEEAISKGIKSAGYKPLLVSLEHHNEKICDRIVADIRKSRFLVADFTRHRQNVYFEAGFAMGLGMQVIWLCHKKDIAPRKVHFDTRQYNHIVWEEDKLAELQQRLKERIWATIGVGPIKPPTDS